MAFKRHRGDSGDKHKAAPVEVSSFRHSSGTDLESVVGMHSLAADAAATAPKGYRARSIAGATKRSR